VNISGIKYSLINLLLDCSGVNKTALHDAKIETPKFVGIGATILFTAILASISGGYAIYFSFNNYFISFVFAILWGAIIFNFDRYIVVSIDKNTIWYRQILMAIPRIIISVVLAITVSKPLEIKMFEKTIDDYFYKKQVVDIRGVDSVFVLKKNLIQKQLIKVSTNETDPLLSEYVNDKSQLLKEQQLINVSINRSDSLRRKILTARLFNVSARIRSVDSLIQRRKNRLNQNIEIEEGIDLGVRKKAYVDIMSIDSLHSLSVEEVKNRYSERDILINIKALNEIKTKDETVNLIGWFITVLFLLIETAPVIVKILSKKGVYEATILAKHNELMLRQRAKMIADRQDLDKFTDEHKKLNDLEVEMKVKKEKSRIGAELTANESMNAYIIKKQSQLSKIKVDKWYDEELTKFNKNK